jgi:ubiquinol-cytochrome c reductase iron-sulfur subunit
MSNEQHTPVSITGLSADHPLLQPAARRPQLVERVIAVLFLTGLFFSLVFVVAYFQNWAPWTLGFSSGLGFSLLGIGLIAWGKYLMPRGPFVEERHTLANNQADRDAFAAAIVERGGGVVKRRKFLGGVLGAGVGVFSLAVAFQLLRSLGPMPKGTLFHTDWGKGTYLVDITGRRVNVSDLAIGSIVTVYPEGMQETDSGQAVDQTVLIRLSNQDFTTMRGRETWAPQGYVAYSKLCTHLGCPVGLYEQELELLVCPCHQSMFNVANGAMPTFGPAPRPLPQLPLMVDAMGYLQSQSDFHEPVGPGFWERRS